MIDGAIERVIEYASFLHRASSAMDASNETKFGTKVAYGWGWCPNVEYTHSAEKARDTRREDENARRNMWRPF